jgi:hypothetical protein
MHHYEHTTYQSEERCQAAIARFFEGWDSHKAYKEKRSASRTHQETDTQKVKKALKAAGYPVTSVTRGRGTAAHWIEITIDDYQSIPDETGHLKSRYGDVMAIAQLASGREHLRDDPMTDLFMVNISVNFTKVYRCSECIISNCDKYHTPEMSACGGFHSREMSDKAAAYYQRQELPAPKPAVGRYDYLNVTIEEVPA